MSFVGTVTFISMNWNDWGRRARRRASGKPEKYLTHLAGLFPAYSENKPVKNGDHGIMIKKRDHSVKPH
jgi:hypothetical protein